MSEYPHGLVQGEVGVNTWTAIVNNGVFFILAQHKNSRALLEKRIKADDPVWSRPIRWVKMRKWDKRFFHKNDIWGRQIAMRCFDKIPSSVVSG